MLLHCLAILFTEDDNNTTKDDTDQNFITKSLNI